MGESRGRPGRTRGYIRGQGDQEKADCADRMGELIGTEVDFFEFRYRSGVYSGIKAGLEEMIERGALSGARFEIQEKQVALLARMLSGDREAMGQIQCSEMGTGKTLVTALSWVLRFLPGESEIGARMSSSRASQEYKKKMRQIISGKIVAESVYSECCLMIGNGNLPPNWKKKLMETFGEGQLLFFEVSETMGANWASRARMAMDIRAKLMEVRGRFSKSDHGIPPVILILGSISKCKTHVIYRGKGKWVYSCKADQVQEVKSEIKEYNGARGYKHSDTDIPGFIPRWSVFSSGFGMVIIDEVHEMFGNNFKMSQLSSSLGQKNSFVTILCRSQCRRAHSGEISTAGWPESGGWTRPVRVMLLSGTCIGHKIQDVLPLLQLLCPHIKQDYKEENRNLVLELDEQLCNRKRKWDSQDPLLTGVSQFRKYLSQWIVGIRGNFKTAQKRRADCRAHTDDLIGTAYNLQLKLVQGMLQKLEEDCQEGQSAQMAMFAAINMLRKFGSDSVGALSGIHLLDLVRVPRANLRDLCSILVYVLDCLDQNSQTPGLAQREIKEQGQVYPVSQDLVQGLAVCGRCHSGIGSHVCSSCWTYLCFACLSRQLGKGHTEVCGICDGDCSVDFGSGLAELQKARDQILRAFSEPGSLSRPVHELIHTREELNQLGERLSDCFKGFKNRESDRLERRGKLTKYMDRLCSKAVGPETLEDRFGSSSKLLTFMNNLMFRAPDGTRVLDRTKVVFNSFHIPVLDLLQQYLERHPMWYRASDGTSKQVRIMRIDGKSSKDSQRAEMLDQFKKTEDLRILLFSDCGSTGIECNNAVQLVFMAERKWTPAEEEQLVARFVRFGSVKETYLMHLTVEGTFDESLHEMAHMKGLLSDLVFGQDLEGSIQEFKKTGTDASRLTQSVKLMMDLQPMELTGVSHEDRMRALFPKRARLQ